MKGSVATILIALLVPAVGSDRSADRTPMAEWRIESLPSPAGPGSRLPNLAALPDGGVLMSWMEPAKGGSLALRCASFDGRSWSAPATIAEGDSFFANWADFPSVQSLGGARAAAHWLWKVGAGTYAYHVRIRQSADGGRTWGPAVTPHQDGTATEHGFVSLLPAAGGVRAVWLDGRKGANVAHSSPAGTPDMTLRTAVISRAGAITEEAELDGRICDCCQTAAALTDRGVLVAYRDRSAGEVRDIFLTRLEGGRWSAPRPVHADGWEIPGCPVNGPALAAAGSRAVIVWFTGANDSARVLCAFSNDGGARFGPPLRLNDGKPLGRVHVVLLEDGSALASWVEAQGKEAVVRARRMSPGAAPGAPFTIAGTSAARASGFPRLVRNGRRVIAAWTESGTTTQVRLAFMTPATTATAVGR